jgi:hypothetical protein
MTGQPDLQIPSLRERLTGVRAQRRAGIGCCDNDVGYSHTSLKDLRPGVYTEQKIETLNRDAIP